MKNGRPGKDELLLLPLGGAGEIGMNLSLYGHAGSWLMVDLGITFGGETTPGIEVLMPDPAFIVEHRDKLVGLILTHAHEDHLGAVPYLWSRLRCPVYATPFAAAVLRQKLRDTDLRDLPITEVPLSGRFKVGPFDIELVTLTHSIPEPNAVVIRTPLGVVLHTGDWKLDPDPVIGPTTDEAALRRLGDDGVLAMVCDSTNALVPGESGSEAALHDSLSELVGRYRERVAITSFSSNVARLKTFTEVARAHGRRPALVGRSLWRMEQAARATGYLKGVPEFVTEHDVGYLPRDEVLLICTGSQGEPRSALARIARGEHSAVELQAGDVAIFSSRVIPGNEHSIGRLQNNLIGLGVEVVGSDSHFVHVSGHPAQDELTRMYQWVRPAIAVPVHGELRHMMAHARLAESCQVPQAIVPANGRVIRLAPGPAEVVGEVRSGRLGLDGTVLVPLEGTVLKSRHRIAFNGVVVVTLVLDTKGRILGQPQLTLQGVVEPGEEAALAAGIGAAIGEALESLSLAERRSDEVVREAARRAARRVLRELRGKKPTTDIHLVRV